MDWLLIGVKVRRVFRRMPMQAWAEFALLFSKSNLIGFFLALIGSYIIVQGGTEEAVAAEFLDWEISARAFGIVLIGWAALSILFSPIYVVLDDRKRGQWFGRRFVYIEPKLIKMIRCKPTGKPEYHEFIWPDAEPGSFVNYEIVLDGGNMPMIKVGLYGRIVIGLLPVGQSKGQSGGLLLPKDNRTVFAFDIDPQSVSTTARIYCKSFSIGNPDDKDGSDGNRPSPFRQSVKSHDRP